MRGGAYYGPAGPAAWGQGRGVHLGADLDDLDTKLKAIQAAWAKHVQGTCSELSDMMRVHGIKEETADAPEEAGVGRNRTLDMEGPGMTRAHIFRGRTPVAGKLRGACEATRHQ